MKITIVEKVARNHAVTVEGVTHNTLIDECTGRSWDIELPFDTATIKGDIIDLASQIARAIRFW